MRCYLSLFGMILITAFRAFQRIHLKGTNVCSSVNIVRLRNYSLALLICFVGLNSCGAPPKESLPDQVAYQAPEIPPLASEERLVMVDRDVAIRDYFAYMAGLVSQWDSLVPYSLDEHLLVWANSWIIDSLANTDYYHLMNRGVFQEDLQALIILRKGDLLRIPDSLFASLLLEARAATILDLNIPEYKLRIYEGDCLLHTFLVRVGQNRTRHLAMAGRDVDLRTHTGVGSIVRINRNPRFVNPRDNKEYESTLRDDGRRTGLPLVPWIEPELDGQRFGQLIHPTTNPATLGKPYSNGCVGVGEGDMWRIYYHAPLGTKVQFRYQLEVVDEAGDTLLLSHIYPDYRPTTADKAPSPLLVCSCGPVGEEVN